MYTICYDIQKGYVLSHNVCLKRQYNTYSFIHGCTYRTTCTHIRYLVHTYTHAPTHPPTHPHTHTFSTYIHITVSERITHVQIRLLDLNSFQSYKTVLVNMHADEHRHTHKRTTVRVG